MKMRDKIAITAVCIIVIILGSVKFSMDNLKKETENGFQEIAKLHVNTFSNQINQIFNNINVTIFNISNQIQNKIDIEKTVSTILSKNVYIRSINIIDDKNTIIFSSNKNNINQIIEISEYYPKPMFYNSILRFGNVSQGRDLFDNTTGISYIPVAKKIFTVSMNYTILIIVNSEYITNKYQSSLKNNGQELEIIRFDDFLLYSSSSNSILGKKVNYKQLYKQAKDKSIASGIEDIHNRKFITAYQLTDDYPLVISVKFDYEKNLQEWENKTSYILLLIGIISFLIALIVTRLLIKYQNTQNKEIEYQKTLLEHQDKIKHAYIVYNNTNDGILITDANKKIIDVNKAFTLNTGYSISDVYGKNPRLLKSNVHNDAFYKNMWKELDTNNHWRGEVVNKTKNGDVYVELLTINVVMNAKGEINNYIGVFTNITQQKEQEILLKEQERFIHQQSKMASMGEMLENIAHQWRQPLSIISTAATGMKMEKEFGVSKEESEMEKLTLINDSAQHLSKTIDDFRDFFKPDKKVEEFYVEDVFQQSMKILESKFKNRNIHIEKNIFNTKVRGYKGELVQVFMNILNNARDALESKTLNERFIMIDIFTEDKNVVIKITDSAGGIDENIIDKVFEPYFTTKHKSQGTGIGLYMSEEIITKHMNGKINVYNSNIFYENKTFYGACFCIEIPSV